MNTAEIVIEEGMTVKGFQFADAYYNKGKLRFQPYMKNYIGVEGEVFRITDDRVLCGIQFPDGNLYYYPTELVVNHIVK